MDRRPTYSGKDNIKMYIGEKLVLYIAKFLRIGHGGFLKISENSISITIGNFYMSYPTSDVVLALYNKSVVLTT
jgi:hypothetical protein